MERIVELSKEVTRWVHIIGIVVSVTVLSIITVLVYWYTEPDPLEVNYIMGTNIWSTCQDRKFTFSREVKSTKDLKVTVKEFWWNVDGIDDAVGKKNEYVHSKITTYILEKGTDQIFTFPKYVPSNLPVGRYEYRPLAEYEVNPLKTISRDLPIQLVNVVCNHDPTKHNVPE